MVPPLVELALNYYRSPLDYSHLADVAQSLPRGFPSLVADFGAALSNARIEETAQQLSTTPDELQAAARFFARHALLNPASDHYRCLGLNRKSTSDEIRSNYKTLIRLFHPDRMSEVDEVDLAYSSRLNAAYRVLRDPEARATYDKGLRRRGATPRGYDKGRYFQPDQNQLSTTTGSRRFGQSWSHPRRATPIAGLALLLVLAGLGFVWLGGEKGTATLRLTQPAAEVSGQQALPRYLKGLGAGANPISENDSRMAHQETGANDASGAATNANPATQNASQLEKPLASMAPDARPLNAAQMPHQPLQASYAEMALKPNPLATLVITESTATEGEIISTGRGVNSVPAQQPLATDGLQPHPSIDERIDAMLEAAIADTKPPPPKPAQKPEIQPTPAPRNPDPAPAPISQPPQKPKVVAKPKPQSTATTPTTATRVEQRKPAMTAERTALIGAKMVGRLEGAYRSGNASAFAALFTTNAKTTDGNGRATIRRLYADLFRQSTEQSMSVKRIRWSLAASGTTTGRGQVTVSVKDRGAGWRRLNGNIRLELAKTGDDYRAASFYYDVN
ncbi:MAG: DnaJ domain-containing protein [Chromatiaceae bacterium]|nr:DnaJ domain-containing protein [Chromatiaceae bacterium]